MKEESGNPHRMWGNELCIAEIIKQLPHRDAIRMERVSSSFMKASRRSFTTEEKVSLDFGVISKENFSLQCFQAIWDEYWESERFGCYSRITAITVPKRIQGLGKKKNCEIEVGLSVEIARILAVYGEAGDQPEDLRKIIIHPRDDLVLHRLGECYGTVGPQLPRFRNQGFALRTLRLNYVIETSNDLNIFQRTLRNLPQLKVLQFGMSGMINRTEKISRSQIFTGVGLEDLFVAGLTLPELVEFHLTTPSRISGPLLSGPSFAIWTPNLKILNLSCVRKNFHSIDKSINKCSFDLIGDCAIEELRLGSFAEREFYSILSSWTGRKAKMLRTLRILHVEHDFSLVDIDLLQNFQNLIEIKCDGFKIPDCEILIDHFSNIAITKLRRLEFGFEGVKTALNFIGGKCVKLNELRLIPTVGSHSATEGTAKVLKDALDIWEAREQKVNLYVQDSDLGELCDPFRSSQHISVLPFVSLFKWH